MRLQSQYDQLIAALERTIAQTPHVGSANIHLHQRVIDEAGVQVIEFEHLHKIVEARDLLEHERFVIPQLAQMEEMLAHYSRPLEYGRSCGYRR